MLWVVAGLSPTQNLLYGSLFVIVLAPLRSAMARNQELAAALRAIRLKTMLAQTVLYRSAFAAPVFLGKTRAATTQRVKPE
jgi:hypothetical protein